MIEFLENDKLRVKIKVIGAELCGIYSNRYNCEYIWQAREAWRSYAPNLFPIVGQLKEEKYYYKKTAFKMERHGFARKKLFKLLLIKPDEIELEITDDETTLTQYPFYFKYRVHYQLIDNKVVVTYTVSNNSPDVMYFSVGGHPAFNVPFNEDEGYNDYFLKFEMPEKLEHFPIKDNLLITKPIKLKTEEGPKGRTILSLRKKLFENDALVFKQLKSREVALCSLKNDQQVIVRFPGFNHLGIWAAKNADFVCIEPWLGLADSEDSTQDLTKKESIILLEGHQSFSCKYEIEVSA